MRKINYDHVKDFDAESAWNLMTLANAEDDMDEFKEHMWEYIKACAPITMDSLETGFRSNDFRYYLQSLTTEVTFDKCIIGPSGQTDCEFTWMLGRSSKPNRARALKGRLAANSEENIERLAKAGVLVDELRPYCFTCKGTHFPFPMLR